MDLKLDGRTALVTGATAGIGHAIAAALAREGAMVTVTGRTRDKVDAAVESLSGDGRVLGAVADVATADGAERLIAQLPQVDILVNNLGIYESKPFDAITDEDWRHFFEVNVLSGARLARHYFPAMIERGWGRVVFVSSESALMIPPDMIHYAMTKTAQLAIARGLAETTKGTGVTVNAVMPGPTRSAGIVDFMKSMFPGQDLEPKELEPEFFRLYRSTSLIQRLIDPAEIASLVAYLASPLASATNGAALRVEGGLVRTIA
ncbi:MAG TPA: SDR family oxidoreductase [Geminicoccus sp.]|jgi:NAD(P)-dependent dehydrogenase (short-subunit alcohol dehydrogenase family)|uniref:SDR family NAD(P)-dependent oxidoreductase n=1 Tax=Geminicoccus sp. TaxID=2024832 RepID=UPI002E34B96D|nr:SDR family oxidoreductase [Geminicoccus sp.]HEX2529584.1 SDR family oxidoreductase [Geminicoccus sp.]